MLVHNPDLSLMRVMKLSLSLQRVCQEQEAAIDPMHLICLFQ
jgi:hypothetical protein